MTKKEIKLAEKNVWELIKALKEENLTNAWIFIQNDLANKLSATADKLFELEGIQEIKWLAKDHVMGFVDFQSQRASWRKVYRINDGTTLFLEKNQIPTRIIFVK